MPSPRRPRPRLLVSIGRDHRWAAWLEDERVVEFHHEREGAESPLGNIYLGRVTRVEKGLGAAFVDIGMRGVEASRYRSVSSTRTNGRGLRLS
jgi:hypothetical protein